MIEELERYKTIANNQSKIISAQRTTIKLAMDNVLTASKIAQKQRHLESRKITIVSLGLTLFWFTLYVLK